MQVILQKYKSRFIIISGFFNLYRNYAEYAERGGYYVIFYCGHTFFRRKYNPV